MTIINKFFKGRDEYLRKLKNGEIPKPIVLDPIEKAKANPKSLRAAINGYCYECSGKQRTEVRECTCNNCPLYLVRPWQKK